MNASLINTVNKFINRFVTEGCQVIVGSSFSYAFIEVTTFNYEKE